MNGKIIKELRDGYIKEDLMYGANIPLKSLITYDESNWDPEKGDFIKYENTVPSSLVVEGRVYNPKRDDIIISLNNKIDTGEGGSYPPAVYATVTKTVSRDLIGDSKVESNPEDIIAKTFSDNIKGNPVNVKECEYYTGLAFAYGTRPDIWDDYGMEIKDKTYDSPTRGYLCAYFLKDGNYFQDATVPKSVLVSLTLNNCSRFYTLISEDEFTKKETYDLLNKKQDLIDKPLYNIEGEVFSPRDMIVEGEKIRFFKKSKDPKGGYYTADDIEWEISENLAYYDTGSYQNQRPDGFLVYNGTINTGIYIYNIARNPETNTIDLKEGVLSELEGKGGFVYIIPYTIGSSGKIVKDLRPDGKTPDRNIFKNSGYVCKLVGSEIEIQPDFLDEFIYLKQKGATIENYIRFILEFYLSDLSLINWQERYVGDIYSIPERQFENEKRVYSCYSPWFNVERMSYQFEFPILDHWKVNYGMDNLYVDLCSNKFTGDVSSNNYVKFSEFILDDTTIEAENFYAISHKKPQRINPLRILDHYGFYCNGVKFNIK